MIVAEKKAYYEVLPGEQYSRNIDGRRVSDRRQHKNKKLKAVLKLGMVFAVAILIISRFAIVSECKYDLRQLEKELEGLKKANERLVLRQAQAQDINWIEEYAVSTLGMVYPENRDVVYVAVESPEDKTGGGKEPENNGENRYPAKGWVAALIGKMNSVFYRN